MKCPKKNKNCKPVLCYMTKKKNYICSGINKKPTKYKYDTVSLCLNGKLSSCFLEMTKDEALAIISVLSTRIVNKE